MLCPSLTALWPTTTELFSPRSLQHGSMMEEPQLRPDATFDMRAMPHIRAGKDESIIHMLEGGNGFPAIILTDAVAEHAFDLGCTAERRDMKSMLMWSQNLNQCIDDRRKGATA